MGRRNEHTREELREIALRAAEDLVASQGLTGLSTRKIVTRIGYTVGSLYMVFRSLDDLIIQMNERTLDALHRQLLRATADSPPPTAAIRALAQAYIDFALTQTNRWLAVYQHRLPEGESIPDSFTERVTRMFELVQRQLALLCPRRSSDEIALASRALWSGVHGICILGFDQKLEVAGGHSLQDVAGSMLDHYLSGFTQA
ncbi:MAG TPA: TetR/AcrR family transcriptional regulator [Candidatus Competibacteraceae bacterium]|nr:MAG: TetR/AcrR family transcriptional regulator [Candidatus Competibacteraceae bacterium]HOB61269.1 TetR/AcrR family transcriptional regulator [Candidatus Competibacteraceae bacterium]HQA24586.1 TetR/AcrR family transcriptional regulator [Candidatus Competibacteraceae bacterium]HQD55644.1 TetR/AcrR family transcriptional regulator [Candidatus Competibacteraceae bacterium]